MGLKRCCRGGIGLNKVGLDGNIFNRNYNRLGYLASHSWFKILCDTKSNSSLILNFTLNQHGKLTVL
jgi:hypothetical protein